MKRLIYLIILVCFFFSCKKKDNGLTEDLYNVILKYQKENDFSKSKNFTSFSKNYVYRVNIDTTKKDTIIFITTDPIGYIGSLKKVYGIYSDDNLHPTIIEDENKIGKKFVLEYRKKNLDFFKVTNPPNFTIPVPIYLYNVKNGKLIFEWKSPLARASSSCP